MKAQRKRILALAAAICMLTANVAAAGGVNYAAAETGDLSAAGVQGEDDAGQVNIEDGTQSADEGTIDQSGTGSAESEAQTDQDGTTDQENPTDQADAADWENPTDQADAAGQENPTDQAGVTEDNTEAQSDTQPKENSWRYKDGSRVNNPSFRSGYRNAWNKENGQYVNDNGDPIPGATLKGIDVSEHNGDIDWEKVKAAGIEYAILRCGYGNDEAGQDDKKWAYNVSECERLGIPYGVYIYSYATDLEMAQSEAQHVLRLISGHNLSYPVYFDLEDDSTVNISNDVRGQMAQKFCDIISQAGYRVGIYANTSWWNTYLTNSAFDNANWSKWVAQWNSVCEYGKSYDMWQCSDGYGVSGISTSVDLNFWMQPVENQSVSYQSYVSGSGWQSTKSNGQTSGTTGAASSLEAIKLKIDNAQYSGSVVYDTFMQSHRWMGETSDFTQNGLPGSGKRMEAVKIRLTGQMAEHYDIYYRAHVQSFGWLGWAKNGETAGSSDYAKRLEAVQVVLVEKGGAAPGSTDTPYQYRSLSYVAHTQTYGWLPEVYDGEDAGTQGLAKRMEALQIKLLNPEYTGGIQYRTHVQTYGWLDWVENGQEAGTTGLAKRMEALQIRLTGEIANHYDIYYRVHAQTYGWMGWAKNGEDAGTTGLAKRLEAVEIQLVPKGGTAPQSTATPYIGA